MLLYFYTYTFLYKDVLKDFILNLKIVVFRICIQLIPDPAKNLNPDPDPEDPESGSGS